MSTLRPTKFGGRAVMASFNEKRFMPRAFAFVWFSAALFALSTEITKSANALEESPSKIVAVTVDDLPGAAAGTDKSVGNLKDLQRVNRLIPQILNAHNAPAIGFVNEWKLNVPGERDARVALLQSWLDVGMILGNHGYHHEWFWRTPLAEYEDDVIRGDVVTRALMKAAGHEENYFRHPNLSTGPTSEAKAAFEAFLRERGYRVAPVTIDNADWQFNDVLGAALEKDDKQLANKTKEAYLAYMNAAFDYYEGVSRSLFHRDIAQVLLIHDSELTAECLDQLLTNLERRGYRFVTLDDALTDPAYMTPDKFIGSAGFSWLIRWKLAFGQQADWQNEPDPPAWVMKVSDEMRHPTQKH